MKYRRLGKTGLRVSVIGVGTWQLGGEWNKEFTQDEVDQMFDKARECGMNLIDTAECYGDHTSEAFVGKAIQRDRANWIVATKFGHKFHTPFNRTEPRTPRDVEQQVEDSLKALRTDYLDILQYHSWGDVDFNNAEVKETCRKLVKSGKVRHLGNSIGSNENIYQTDKSDAYGVEVIQVIYNRLDRKPEDQVFASCMRQDLGVLARVPLASGFLSGKYRPGHKFDENEVRGKWRNPKADELLKQVEQIRATEVHPGVEMSQWALAWCLQHPAVTCVIPGCKSVQQVEDNANAADLDIVKEDHPQAWKGK